MIYVGIGSLQCSMENRDLKPIMLHGDQLTIANSKTNKITWRLMTINSRKVFWLDVPKVYENEDVEYALKYLEVLKQNMKEEFSTI